MNMPLNREEIIFETVEKYAMWERGVGHEWEYGAIVDAVFLEDLIFLAKYAPKDKVLAFCEKYKETE